MKKSEFNELIKLADEKLRTSKSGTWVLFNVLIIS